ncbi:hypothetical protein [Campylobacter ornithocola]|nr:hypothetical protein [Campylobacter ornithocola]
MELFVLDCTYKSPKLLAYKRIGVNLSDEEIKKKEKELIVTKNLILML